MNERFGEDFMPEMSERRRFTRYPCTGAVDILRQAQPYRLGKVTVINRLGCYVETLESLEVGILVQIRLNILDIALDIKAMTVSTTPKVGMGMEFIAVAEEQENTIARILAKVIAAGPSPVLR
jgi:hypothetical protein